ARSMIDVPNIPRSSRLLGSGALRVAVRISYRLSADWSRNSASNDVKYDTSKSSVNARINSTVRDAPIASAWQASARSATFLYALWASPLTTNRLASRIDGW